MPRMFLAATDPSAMTTGGRGQGTKGTQGNSAGGGDSAPQGLGPKQERAADPSSPPRSKAWERHKLVSGGRPVLTPSGTTVPPPGQRHPQGRRGRPVLRESHLTRSSCDADMPPFKSWGSVPPPCVSGWACDFGGRAVCDFLGRLEKRDSGSLLGPCRHAGRKP